MTQADRVFSTPPLNTSVPDPADTWHAGRADSPDSFSSRPGTRQPETGKRISDFPRPVPIPSNVLAFPVGRPSSNVRELHNVSFSYGGGTALWRSPVYKSSGRPNMHTFVFRSYELILDSSQVDLVRDVRCDAHKAATKLNSIRQQIRRDREHAAAREDLLTRAEARLAAALA